MFVKRQLLLYEGYENRSFSTDLWKAFWQICSLFDFIMQSAQGLEFLTAVLKCFAAFIY
jgi:hypothetical protein